MHRTDKRIWVGMGVAVALSAAPLVHADSMPSEADASDAAATGSVSQFGQVETLPTPAPAPVMAAPGGMSSTPAIPTQASASASSADAAPTQGPANPSGINFPKVMTPQDERQALRFDWWPSDAAPGPVKDTERSGYWWWPDQPGTVRPWGNQGYIYVRKIIFDYKAAEGPMKPSLIIKRIIQNVKVYFDYDKSDIRDDAAPILNRAIKALADNDKADILITGNADVRGSEQYNQKLGESRADSVRRYFAENGVDDSRIKILSRGKLDAMAPKGDIVGMQKDRNAQFMVAEVEEVMIPADKAEFFQDKVIEEQRDVEGEIKVGFKEYTIQSGDTLWKIAEREFGNGRQWKRIYDYNRDVISNPDRPRKGTTIRIPIE